MAVQTKTLLNDVGSAVLVEAVSQLNRAAAYSNILVGTTLTAVAADMAFVLCKFTEDVLVTRVEFGFGSTAAAAINNAADVVQFATGTNPDGTGGTVICSATDFTVPFATTDVWATMADLQAVAATDVGSDAPFQVDAGDALSLQFALNAGSQVVTAGQTLASVTVSYRPVKDALNLQPAFTPAMTRFKTVAR